MRFSRIAMLAFVVLTLAGTTFAQTYSVTDLGVLSGDTASEGLFITNNHAIVGCADVAALSVLPCLGTPSHAFLWTSQQGILDLGTLPGGNSSTANGANDAGQVVGAAATSTSTHAFLWTQAAGMQDLGTLPGGTFSWAADNNSDGWILGYSDYPNSNGDFDLAVWDPSGNIHDLGALPNSFYNFGEGMSQGDDILNHGYIVGVAFLSFAPLRLRAIYWTKETGVQEFAILNGSYLSEATSVNALGITSGWCSSSGPFGSRALLWDRSGRYHDLGTLPGWQSTAYYINDRNQVVGFLNTATESHAMYWSQESGMQDMNNMISSDSGWVLQAAIGINNEGEITGYGTINGENHAVLLTPQSGDFPAKANVSPDIRGRRQGQALPVPLSNPRLVIQTRGD